MWFIQFCMYTVNDYSLSGRIDNYLFPFYKKDIDDGVLTKELAQTIIDQLYFKHNEIYGNWPASVMLGGTDRQGKAVLNDLTYICLDAIKNVKLVNPSVAICYREEMPDDILEKSIELIRDGYTRPSLFNDELISNGLLKAGVSGDDAGYYVHSTCVEITPVAASNILVATPYINIMRVFEYVFTGELKKIAIGNVTELGPGWGGTDEEIFLAHHVPVDYEALNSFDAFKTLIKNILRELIASHLNGAVTLTEQRKSRQASPLASMFINDCIKKGIDCGAGGARYNFVYPCFPGFSSFVDSLAAVKKAVYDDNLLSLDELSEQLKSNYSDKRIRNYLLNSTPKFGNGDDNADKMAVEIFDFIYSEVSKYKTNIGGTFYPSYFAYVMHGILGRETCATPDGRLRGEALSECLGPVGGMDKNGPLGIVDSIAKLDQRLGIGGIATNLRFSPSVFESANGKKAFLSYIRHFFKKQCFEMQFNVLSSEELKEAQKHPEKYETLIVRVAGYSDYFVSIPTEIQNEIIGRTEHGKDSD